MDSFSPKAAHIVNMILCHNCRKMKEENIIVNLRFTFGEERGGWWRWGGGGGGEGAATRFPIVK